MIHYLIHALDGTIQQRGQCRTEDDLPIILTGRIEIIEKNDPRRPEAIVRDSYGDFRRMDYPSFGNQLDAIWKALEATGALDQQPEAKAMFERIQAVKGRHPKNPG